MIYSGKLKRFGVYRNDTAPYKTMEQVKAETGCDVICNGFMFNTSTARPVYSIKLGGVVLAEDKRADGTPEPYWGYSWNDGEAPTLEQWPTSKANFITTGVAFVGNGKPIDFYEKGDIQGTRGRTAIGWTKDGHFILWCSSDSKEPKTMKQLQQIMLDAGCDTAINLDGGGSSECITPGGTVTTTRTIYNFFCAWLDGHDEETETTKMKVCLDPGHGGTDNTNSSPDKSYYEHQGNLDMALRVRKLIAPYVDVVMTRETDASVGLSDRATIANNAGADIYLSIHSNATGGGGWSDASGLTAWTYAEGGERDVLATALLARFEAAGIKLFGSQLYHSHFTVLAETNMPAVLVEYGFHTNKDDVTLLKTDAYRDKLAMATALGILDYLGIEYVPAEKPQPDEKTYRVQVGAFSVKASADALAAKLRNAGYSTIIKED